MPDSGRGQTGGKGFWILGGIAVVVAFVIVGYFGMSNRQPADETAGAIGAAKKHVEDQIGDDDVVLAETQVHEFMQSETFQKMVDDADFRKAVLNRYLEMAVVRALGSPEYRQLPPQAHDPLQRPVFRDPGPMTPGDIGDVIAQLEVQARSASGRDAEALNRLVNNQYFHRMMEHPGFIGALESGAIANRLEQRASVQ